MKDQKDMDYLEIKEFYSGVHEVELTEELIIKLSLTGYYGSYQQIKEMADMGMKFNTQRGSFVMTDYFDDDDE